MQTHNNTTGGLTEFSFDQHQVRVFGTPEKPLFVAKDICDALGLENVTNALRGFPEDDITTSKVIDTLGRQQEALAVTEPGLYRLIFQSRKPEAEKFKTWVFTEVLPSIRRTGVYAHPTHPDARKLHSLELQVEAQKLRVQAAALDGQARAALLPPPRPEGWLTIGEILKTHPVGNILSASAKAAAFLKGARENKDYVWVRDAHRINKKAYRPELLAQALGLDQLELFSRGA